MSEAVITLSATFPDRESLNAWNEALSRSDFGVTWSRETNSESLSVRWEVPLRKVIESFYLFSYEQVKSVHSDAWLAFGANKGNHVADAREPWENHLSNWDALANIEEADEPDDFVERDMT